MSDNEINSIMFLHKVSKKKKKKSVNSCYHIYTIYLEYFIMREKGDD